jgi:4-carboxymuconolactone decarboxylase
MDSPLAPRIEPVADDDRTPRQREVIADLVQGPTVNVYTTLAHSPDLAAAMVNFGRNLRGPGLSARHREILILRTGWNCRCRYELAQHQRLARSIGMTDEDLGRIEVGPEADGWDPFEALLCQLADELHRDQQVSDETWAALAARYDDSEMIHAVLVVGYYHAVSMILNAARVALEPEAEEFAPAVTR